MHIHTVGRTRTEGKGNISEKKFLPSRDGSVKAQKLERDEKKLYNTTHYEMMAASSAMHLHP